MFYKHALHADSIAAGTNQLHEGELGEGNNITYETFKLVSLIPWAAGGPPTTHPHTQTNHATWCASVTGDGYRGAQHS